jgi:hypothetical protein
MDFSAEQRGDRSQVVLPEDKSASDGMQRSDHNKIRGLGRGG